MEKLKDLVVKTPKELEAIIQQLNDTIAAQHREIESLRYQLNKALHQRFGRKSEKEPENQLSFFDEVVQPDNVGEIVQAESEITIAAHQRKKPGRKPITPDLPRVQHIHDIPEAQKSCACGCALTKIGEEITEQLDFIPARAQVIQHVHYKYACKACEDTIITAKSPKQPIPQSIASPGLLAHIAVSKYCDGLPLYRMEEILQRMGIDIARNTLSHWMIKSSELLLPLYKLLQYNLITYDIAFADETPIQVLKEPGRPAGSKSYMWVFIGGPPEKRSIVYYYDVSRGSQVPLKVLDDFKGWLHCDGHSAYDTYAKLNSKVVLLGCWMHVRRRFYEITKLMKTEGLAQQAIRKIAKLYHIEEEIKAKCPSPEDVYAHRQQYSKPLVLEFKKWLDDNVRHVRPKSPLGEAFGYALNQWEKLTRYLEDGRLEMDNGESERKIKPFVMGRKAWLFCDSIAGARAAEIIYSIIQTAKHHFVEPYTYLRDVLARLPNVTTEEELEALLPYNINHKG